MNTEEIRRALEFICGDEFLGVYSRNTMPRHLPTGRSIIVVNTDPSYKPGTHWIAMRFDNAFGEYFDSFGRYPEKTFETYMNEHCRAWTFNDKQIQSVASKFCGCYIVFVAAYWKLGYCMHRIVSNFSSDYGLNDVMAHEFACRRLKAIMNKRV